MTDTAISAGRPRRARGAARRGLAWLSMAALAALAGAPVAYMLWPQVKPVTPDAPSLPITIGGVTFNAPPAAIRFKMQRRAGPQARIDLAFVWPSLEAPPPPSAVTVADAPRVTDRIFVTVANSDTTLAPTERLKAIYPRYLTPGPAVDMGGLQVRAFQSGSPYQGEDLIVDPRAPERFMMRCTQSHAKTPGTCLHERRVGGADITVRFPREWLSDWRGVADGIDRLISRMSRAN